jgi:hypothetical protein
MSKAKNECNYHALCDRVFQKEAAALNFHFKTAALVSKYAILAYLTICQNCGFFYYRRRQILYHIM